MEENRFFENLLGFPDLEVLDVEHFSNKIIINCKIRTIRGKCPNCKKETTLINQYTMHCAQDLSICGKEVWLKIKVPQFVCQYCNRFFTHKISWLESGKSYTQRQSRWIFELSAKQAFTEVAAIVNKSIKTIERIYLKIANNIINIKERLRKVRWLGIDEIAHRKGKGDYVCVLTDLERGIHIDILEFRTKEHLEQYFKKLGTDFCNQIEIVACDFWASYINVSKDLFKNAQVVIDHFHIVKLLNEPLDIMRKKLRKEDKKVEEYKKIKWTLFKHPNNCNEEEKLRLNQAFSKSLGLKEVYNLRNSFHDILSSEHDETVISKQLEDWIEKASKIEDSPFEKFIKTLTLRKKEIVAFTQTRISNAITEGLNNVIRYMKRISFGLPNFDHMRIRVLAYSC